MVGESLLQGVVSGTVHPILTILTILTIPS
jgi:hypothetical protein